MAEITLGDNPVHTNGDLPAVGSLAPAYTLTKKDFSAVSSNDFAGKTVVLNFFPSIETGVCQTAVRTFNERASELDAAILCVSADLPLAAARFCGAEGIENVITGSTFKNPEVLHAYGVCMIDGKWEGMAARAVVVIGADGNVAHAELVPAIGQEPDYDAALSIIG